MKLSSLSLSSSSSFLLLNLNLNLNLILILILVFIIFIYPNLTFGTWWFHRLHILHRFSFEAAVTCQVRQFPVSHVTKSSRLYGELMRSSFCRLSYFRLQKTAKFHLLKLLMSHLDIWASEKVPRQRSNCLFQVPPSLYNHFTRLARPADGVHSTPSWRLICSIVF